MDARNRRPHGNPSSRRAALPILAMLLASMPASRALLALGGAAGMLTVEVGEARAVELHRDGALIPVGRAPIALRERDRVALRDAATRIRLDLPWRSAPLVLQGSGATFIIPPAPELGMPPAWGASYERFWQVAAVPPPSPRTRGVPLPGGGVAAGALRPLDGLPLDGARVLVGRGGIALAWAGGLPPFEVTVASGADGRVLAREVVQARQVRFADIVVPTTPVTVTLRDAEGSSVAARLQPEARLPAGFPAAAAAAAPVAHAIALYEEAGPEWRLEALRRLLVRAPGDHLAATAAQRILLGVL